MSFEIEDHYTILTPEWVLERLPAMNEHHAGRLRYAEYRTRFGGITWQYDSEQKSMALWINGERADLSKVTRWQFYRICDAIELTVPNDDRSEYGDL